SGFAWSWLGAALYATGLTLGCVNAPGWRYHPAIVAQAAATLAEMYPDRISLAVGSREALNEHIVRAHWPAKGELNGGLPEAVEIFRALWAGETVTHRARLRVEEATLYTRPERPPPIFGAALTAETARWIGGWADGLITVGAPPDALRRLLDAFREGGGDGKPVKVQVALAWAESDAAARRGAHDEWAQNLLGADVLAVLRTPEQLASAARFVSVDDVADRLPISSDPARHADALRVYADLGVETVYLHNVVRNQPAFIDVFGKRVLPALDGGA